MAQQVSDDVWTRLDPSAARLSRRARLRLILAIVALAALVIAGVQMTVSGTVVPRVAVQPGWTGWFEDGTASDVLVNRYRRSGPAPTRVSHGFSIVNQGTYPLKVVGVDTDRPGMRVERVDIGPEAGSTRASLAPGGSYLLKPGLDVPIRIYYEITDCAAVTALPQSIPLVVDRWFGHQRVAVGLPPLRPHRTGGWSVSPGDPKAVPWQRFLADHVCGVAYPDGL